jgi:hypothetical protein
MENGKYLKTLSLGKLNEPATLKICGKTAILQEIAKALKGDLNGEWINIAGPGHSSDDRSLGIKFLPIAPDGFIVNSLSGDDPVECRKYVKANLAEIGVQGAIRHSAAEHEIGSSPDAVKAQRTEAALKIWAQARQLTSFLAPYLKSRGITCAIPSSLRFHPNLRHPSGVFLPAMVALVTRGTDGKPIAIHRTFLAPGDNALPNKVMWGLSNKAMFGPCSGGAVRLGEACCSLMVGEGIETCLSAMQATGRPTWAALSTSGLRALDLPQYIFDVIILADGDDPGERAARHAASRWVREGRRVRIAPAPQGLAGCGKTQRDVDDVQHSNPNRRSIESFVRHRPRI